MTPQLTAHTTKTANTSWSWNITVLTVFDIHYSIYSIPTHDKNQWLLLQFIVFLMMDAKGLRNM